MIRPDHYRPHIIYVKGTKADRVSEIVFFKPKYLTNPAVTYIDKVVEATRALCDTLGKKKQGIHNSTMEALEKPSDMFLTTADNSEDNSWEEPAKNAHKQPSLAQQVLSPLSRLAASFQNTTPAAHCEQHTQTFKETSQPKPGPAKVAQPKRVSREVGVLENTNIIGNTDSPSRSIRLRCASIAEH